MRYVIRSHGNEEDKTVIEVKKAENYVGFGIYLQEYDCIVRSSYEFLRVCYSNLIFQTPHDYEINIERTKRGYKMTNHMVDAHKFYMQIYVRHKHKKPTFCVGFADVVIDRNDKKVTIIVDNNSELVIEEGGTQ